MPMEPPLLSITDVSKRFSLHGGDVEALRDVSLTVNKGEFICLIGASGCGKSTLLRIIAGFESASSGRVEMNGVPVAGPGPKRGMVFQDYALFPWLTVAQNIGFGPTQRGLPRQDIEERTRKFMGMVGLTAFAQRFPSQLSGGMKQRVAIARVLANDADILLMDEPFGALDALTREQLQLELLKIWERTRLTIVFVTHSVEEATVLADRVVVMTAGPGRVESDNPVTLARPREVSTPDFNEARRVLTQKLTSHVGNKAPEGS